MYTESVYIFSVVSLQRERERERERESFCENSVGEEESVSVSKITSLNNRMFIGPCIIVIVEELKTNLMSLVIFISLIICSTCFEH